ncbi:VOC family protein [Actinopolymorpha pittospori]
MSRDIQIVIDAHDPVRLAEFWAKVLGYEPEPAPPGYETWEEFARANSIPKERYAAALIDADQGGPRIFFPTVPEAKRGKNRVHLDVFVRCAEQVPEAQLLRRIEDEVARIVDLGGTRLADGSENGAHWTVMQDPEGNEFCVHG